VTDQNVNEYVTHGGNSNGQIQPVGRKEIRLNAFGIELGNIWKMSKSLLAPRARSVRGGSWLYNVLSARSDVSSSTDAGDRRSNLGFALVRQCR
jgi:hypothetical protein